MPSLFKLNLRLVEMSTQLFAITSRHQSVGRDGPIKFATIERALRMTSLHMKDHLILYRLRRLELIVKINEESSHLVATSRNAPSALGARSMLPKPTIIHHYVFIYRECLQDKCKVLGT
jgi:hypothetical protein